MCRHPSIHFSLQFRLYRSVENVVYYVLYEDIILKDQVCDI